MAHVHHTSPFGERALLADEMGLGKTIQAVAACALLRHLGKAQRALVVTPTSLKTEWEEQIGKFTTLSHQLVFGPRSARLKHYAHRSPPFFTIVNYEQVVSDSLDINEHLRPDIVVLDEAQRIKRPFPWLHGKGPATDITIYHLWFNCR